MLLFVDSLDTLGQNEKTLVDASRFDHALLIIFCPSIVFGSCQINSGSSADANLVGGGDRDLHAENGMGSRRMGIELYSDV